MEKEFDIEITVEEESKAGNVQLPLNFLSFGEIEPDDVKVYIKQDVYKALEKYASSNTSKELGTILIGDYCEELGKTHVIISDYIEAKYTDASASTLTFTHETWDYVHKQHDALYPDKKIIGWQHTHPNYGIFLSNYDLFIQENFFNMSFQIAYVIDPIQNIRGFFQWKNDKIEKLKGYYIYDEVGKPIKIEQTKVQKVDSGNKASSSKALKAVIALLCVVSVALGVFAINANNKYKAQLAAQQTMVNKIQEQEQTINNQKQDINALKNQLVNGIVGDSGINTVEELIKGIENNEIVVENKENVLKELKALVEASKNENDAPVILVAYTVQAGDSLSSICKDHNIDYHTNKNTILALNGISNPSTIYVGQVLILPAK